MSDIDNTVDPPNPEGFPWSNGYSPVTLQINTSRIKDGSDNIQSLIDTIRVQQDTIVDLANAVKSLLKVLRPELAVELSPMDTYDAAIREMLCRFNDIYSTPDGGRIRMDHGTALIYTKQELPEVVRFKIISKLCDYGPHKGSLEHDGVMYAYSVTDAGRVNRDSTRQ